MDCIAFDFGNVLYWFDYGLFFDAVADHSPFSAAELRAMLFEPPVDVASESDGYSLSYRFETGAISSAEFIETFKWRGRITMPDAQFTELFVHIFRPNEPIARLAQSVARRYPIALISNTNDLHFERYMRHIPIFEQFETVTLSHRVGAMKPERAIYEAFLNEQALKPESCIFIDDREENVVGAARLGFHAIQYLPETNLVEELRRHGITVDAEADGEQR